MSGHRPGLDSMFSLYKPLVPEVTTVKDVKPDDYQVIVNPDIPEEAGVSYQKIGDAFAAGYYSIYLPAGKDIFLDLIELDAATFDFANTIKIGTHKTDPARIHTCGNGFYFTDNGANQRLSGTTSMAYPTTAQVDLANKFPGRDTRFSIDGAATTDWTVVNGGYGIHGNYVCFGHNGYTYPFMALETCGPTTMSLLEPAVAGGQWAYNAEGVPGGFAASDSDELSRVGFVSGFVCKFINVEFVDEKYYEHVMFAVENRTMTLGQSIRIKVKDIKTKEVLGDVTYTASGTETSSTLYSNIASAINGAGIPIFSTGWTINSGTNYVAIWHDVPDGTAYEYEITSSDVGVELGAGTWYSVFEFDYGSQPINCDFINVKFKLRQNGSITYDLLHGALFMDCYFDIKRLNGISGSWVHNNGWHYLLGPKAAMINGTGYLGNISGYSGLVLCYNTDGMDVDDMLGVGGCTWINSHIDGNYGGGAYWGYDMKNTLINCSDTNQPDGVPDIGKNLNAAAVFGSIAKRIASYGGPNIAPYIVN